ncbi:PqqD family protein [Streptomyces sp. NPDC001530]|uniref:PqqD family protein n=1 Tax=Streptomyces sp. NPDC001530 TaxID=3364582 RepID=UPI00368C1C10
MRVRPVLGVSVSVDADGCLQLVAETGGRHLRYECGPVGTSMWIALRQHDGNLDAAALVLAGLWGMAPSNVRADLDIWVEEMRDAGLLCVEP